MKYLIASNYHLQGKSTIIVFGQFYYNGIELWEWWYDFDLNKMEHWCTHGWNPTTTHCLNCKKKAPLYLIPHLHLRLLNGRSSQSL